MKFKEPKRPELFKEPREPKINLASKDFIKGILSHSHPNLKYKFPPGYELLENNPPLTYKPGPVQVFLNSPEDIKLGFKPGIGKNYDGYRVIYDTETRKYSVIYDSQTGKYSAGFFETYARAEKKAETESAKIAQFKIDVAFAAPRNLEVTEFLMEFGEQMVFPDQK